MRDDEKKQPVLFGIEISGMGNLVAARGIVEAVNAAAFLNDDYMYAFLAAQAKEGNSELTPCCFASPVVWPYDAESHADALASQLAWAKEHGHAHWMIG